MSKKIELKIKRLGKCSIPSPIPNHLPPETKEEMFVDDEDLICTCHFSRIDQQEKLCGSVPEFEVAGPRELLYFDPSKTRCGIVTCGGLCPGINDVIRALVHELWLVYGVRRIHGFRYGFQGLAAKYGHDVVDLDPDAVDGLEGRGGTVLGSSRGNQDPIDMVDCLERMAINILFVIGGDGTMRGAQAMAAEIDKRDLKISVVGIPKTIDNDIMYLDESFGFPTAYSIAVGILNAAHAESKGAPNGVGLVKLMGRESGFIACHAAIAMSDVNFVLIPELPFKLDGPEGFLEALKVRLQKRHHAVIAVAEGAGQELLDGSGKDRDPSGNIVLKDIGTFLRDRIKEYFKKINMEVNVRYIDPSYTIRSVPSSPQDRVYCIRLAQSAVHAAMAGKTEMLVGRWHGQMVHVPMSVATSQRKKVEIHGELWRTVLESTGQPPVFK
ncbi:MAG: ATP-dependent 6-phosphofructokinase [Planctomycetes bacterium]|nr:ATP-dependent 6-phosphofructokinase [Planctomycetota bacterium]